MDPIQHYSKARRALVFFIGLLALSVFVGVSQRDGSSTSVLPFELARPEYIPHILIVVVLYSLYNVGVAWSLLDEDSRQARVRTVDFTIIVFGCLSVMAAAILYMSGARVRLTLAAVQSFAVPSVLVILSATLVIGVFTYVRVSRRLRQSKEEGALMRILLSEDWLINFNPKLPSGIKKISFIGDGTIGEGRNMNESSWTIEDGELVIWRETGELQNRFRYNPSTSEFISTDDPAADAARRKMLGQKIYPATIRGTMEARE